jgi:glycosyltransferase involved in cell wall biosynthesis
MGMLTRLAKHAATEAVTHDLGPLRAAAATTLHGAAARLLDFSQGERGFDLLSRVHRAAWSPSVDRRIEAQLRQWIALDRQGKPTELRAFCDRAMNASMAAFNRSHSADPTRLLGSRVLVLKPWQHGERGVVLADYSYIFLLLAGFFDLARIAERYFIVLEPSWSGFCTPEILAYAGYDFPVFIEASEPRDAGFIERLETNLHPIPLAANWWVNHRLITPSPRSERDIDLIMVAAWASFKRHWRFFKALSQLRRRGHRPKVVLVGYRMDKTREDIQAEADYFGVGDQVELFENISADEVGRLLARSKIHVLWSRREGVNRALIEAMFADVPVILREGFNYGHRYPYINDATGAYATESTLADTILEMLDNGSRFSPRDWVMDNMTPHHATRILDAKLGEVARAAGQPWSDGLVVKTASLNSQNYWDAGDRDRFDRDYAFLESTVHRSPLRAVAS